MSINKPHHGPVRMYLLLVIYVGLKSSGTNVLSALHRLRTRHQTMVETKIIYRAVKGNAEVAQ